MQADDVHRSRAPGQSAPCKALRDIARMIALQIEVQETSISNVTWPELDRKDAQRYDWFSCTCSPFKLVPLTVEFRIVYAALNLDTALNELGFIH